jgi:RNase P/RNase MRP subunit p29
MYEHAVNISELIGREFEVFEKRDNYALIKVDGELLAVFPDEFEII